jgi:hypothetical protein
MNNIEAIEHALDVIAENAIRRYNAGRSREEAVEGSLREFSASWPKLGNVCREILSAKVGA